MRSFTRMVLVTFGVAGLIACGSSAAKDGSAEEPTNFGDLKSTNTCELDDDCGPGETCRSVRIGEIENRSCVVKDAPDSGAPVIIDSGKLQDAAPGDASKPPPLDAAAFDAGPFDGGGVLCASALTVTILTSGPLASCTYDTTVTAGSANLIHPCSGNGPASVTFGGQTFTGAIIGGVVSVKFEHTYSIKVPSTGTICAYAAVQTIIGTLASGTLAYDYSEKLAAQQPPVCNFTTLACWQKGDVAAAPPIQ